MEERLLISDEIWEQLEPLVQQAKHPAGAPPEQSDREFIEAVLYLVRTGSPWRDLPKELGHWHNVYVRFRRWEKQGVWQDLWHLVREQGGKSLKNIYVESTTVRAHHHASGALKKRAASSGTFSGGG